MYSEDFGGVSETLRASGFIPIPLDGKKPFMNGWSEFWRYPPSDRVHERWRSKNAKANVGLCLGEIIALDIDIDDQLGADTAQAIVLSVLGSSAFVRIGRAPRRTLFYRLPINDALVVSSWRVGRVELLAAGKQSAIFGMHPDTQRPFVWPQRTILGVEKHDIPLVNAAQLEVLRHHLHEAFEGIPEECKPPNNPSSDYPTIGERNEFLFRKGCEIAHDIDSEEELLTSLLGLNSEFVKSLDQKEVRQIVSSVWGYKQRGTLWKSGKDATIVMPVTREVGGEIFMKLGPIACKLYLTLLGTRHSKMDFTIPQEATSKHLGCSVQAISDALKELKQYGLIIDEGKRRGGSSNWRAAKLYRFGSGVGLHTV